jgi:hypothetical protein
MALTTYANLSNSVKFSYWTLTISSSESISSGCGGWRGGSAGSLWIRILDESPVKGPEKESREDWYSGSKGGNGWKQEKSESLNS